MIRGSAVGLLLCTACVSSPSRMAHERPVRREAAMPREAREACADDCADSGHCRLVDDDCVVVSNDDCRRSDECRVNGSCTAELPSGEFERGRCVASSLTDCRNSLSCGDVGLCYLNRAEGACDDGKEPRSEPLMWTGIGTLGLGGVAFFVGFAFSMIPADGCDDGFCPRHGLLLGGG